MTAIEARALDKARQELLRSYKEIQRLQKQELKLTYRGVPYTK